MELKNKSLSWIRGFNYQPGFASHGITRWIDRYNAEQVKMELARGQEKFPWFNTVRLWLSLDAWRDNRPLFLKNMEKDFSTARELGLRVIPVLFNGITNIPDYGCLSPTDADRFMKQDGGNNLRILYLDYIKDIAERLGQDDNIPVWDLCNEPGLNYVKDGDPIREAFFFLLEKSAEELRKYGVKAHIGVGNCGTTNDDKRVINYADCILTHRYWVPHCMTPERYQSNIDQTVEFANEHNLPWCSTECLWGFWDDEKRASILETSMTPFLKAGAGFCAYVLAESPAMDAHGEKAGIVYGWGAPEDLCFIRKDGTLRKGHGIINDIVAKYPAAVPVPPRPKTAPAPSNTIVPGARWVDTDGNLIQAHGGGFYQENGVTYWFGENKDNPTCKTPRGVARTDLVGVSCYSSKDLCHWKNEGIVLAPSQEPDNDLYIKNVMERPKVLFCEKTKKYVMYFHLDNSEYKWKDCGIATADKVTGPYTYQGRFPLNGEDSCDMTLFRDDDGSSWYIYSSEKNETLHFQKLTDDMMGPDGPYIRVLPGLVREAPAIIKVDGMYYLVTSACSGWADNRAMLATATDLKGKWLVLRGGDICFDNDQAFADKTFYSQSTFLLKHKDKYIFMADRWDPSNLKESRYIWLPAEITPYQLKVYWKNSWQLD